MFDRSCSGVSMTWPTSLSDIQPYLADGIGIPQGRLLRCFHPAVTAHIPDILALRQRVFKRDAPGGKPSWDDARYWHWKYVAQPRTATAPLPYWVFEKEGEIIGGMGLQHVQVDVHGKTYPAIWGCDIVVHPSYDTRGLGVFMNLVFQETFPFFLVLGTNARSTHMLAGLSHRLPSLRSYKKLIRTGPALEHRLGSRVLGKACAVVLDPLYALYDRSHRVQIPPGLTFERIEKSDPRIPALCEQIAPHTRVRVRRSTEMLAWRFFDNPRWHYECHGALFEHTLCGYVITRTDGKGGAAIGMIVDWLCGIPTRNPPRSGAAGEAPGPLDEEATPALAYLHALLFQYGVGRLAAQGVSTVYSHACGRVAEAALKRLGFIRDAAADSPFFVESCPREIEADVLSAPNWTLTHGDSDID